MKHRTFCHHRGRAPVAADARRFMDTVPAYIALALSFVGSVWCWRRIWRSNDLLSFKISLALIAVVPFLGPFFYLFADMPPRRPRNFGNERQTAKKPSAFLQRWNEREHIYLGWASFTFWTLATTAYWMNDWTPGNIHETLFRVGHYTDVDVLFFSLLIGAVLTFGAALRAKVILVRKLRETSNLLLQPTGQKRPTAE